ncbi:MAG: DUF4339 domain-containing protein [Oligoflexia bacterium]|nr:DUF4339 domain-containing protein [Oligoflexia bacterium]
MSLKKYFINSGQQNLGPFDFVKIKELIGKNQIRPTDKIYLDDQDKWIVLNTHPEFLQDSENTQIYQKPIQSQQMQESKKRVLESTSDTQWYALRGQERQGPFEFTDILRLLQEKVLFEYDFVWRAGFENWQRVAETAEFEAENIRRHLHSDKNIFLRRKHMRLLYECPLVAHDNKGFWSGYTLEISEAGAGIAIENAMLMPGQSIYLHFKPGSHTKPFNVLCEVVSKKYIKDIRVKETLMIYGVKFINIPKQEKDLIRALSAQAA